MTTPPRRLLDELRRYQPSDETEERHRRALMAYLVHAKTPFSRAQFAPGHVTASLFIVEPKKNQVLLHHHRRLGRWLQMGGHLEPGESPAIAALPRSIAMEAAESNELAWADLDRAIELMAEEASTRTIEKIRRILR